jgi:hypothetical protein
MDDEQRMAFEAGADLDAPPESDDTADAGRVPEPETAAA